MGFYDQRILPNLIGCACTQSPIMKQRARVVPRASGVVLEVGMGGAPNLSLYDPARVTELIGLEPSAGMRRKAERKLRGSGLNSRLLDGRAEAMALPDASVDCIVLTYSLCSIADTEAALAEMHRVLRPQGQLLFCEHGLAPDAGVARWHRRIEPVWKCFSGGCHLTRPMDRLIAAGGFDITELEAAYLPGTPRIVGYDYIGMAQPR